MSFLDLKLNNINYQLGVLTAQSGKVNVGNTQASSVFYPMFCPTFGNVQPVSINQSGLTYRPNTDTLTSTGLISSLLTSTKVTTAHINNSQTYVVSSVNIDGVGAVYISLTTPNANNIPPGARVFLTGTTYAPFNDIYYTVLSNYSTTAIRVNNPASLPNFTSATGGVIAYGFISTTNIAAVDLTATNLNGKLNILGATPSLSGNILFTNNTTNTTGNYDLLTDSNQHFKYTGGSGAGSNVLTVGGATNGGITIPSTAGVLTTNKVSSNASTALTLESSNNSNIVVSGAGTGIIQLNTNGVNRTTIDSTGINTNNINHLSGSSLTIGNASTTSLTLASSGTTNGSTTVNSTGTGAINLNYAGATKVNIGANTRFITTDASVGGRDNQISIGKNHDSGAGNNGALLLGFIGSETTTGANTAATLVSLSSGATWQPMRFYAGAGSAPTENPFSWYSGGVRIQQMAATGLFTVSDERLKNTIQPLDTALSKILSLKPSTFYYNIDTDKEDLVSGFISQEIEPLFPHMITESKVRDDDETTYKFFNPVQLIPYLTKAIQEQQKQIDELKLLIKDKLVI